MRVHPAPRKRNITVHYDVSPTLTSVTRQKKLRRLPHIFSKVLELPFSSDTDVEVEEGPTWLRFIAAAADLDLDGVGGVLGAHTIEIYPGMMKVVIRGGGGGGDIEEELELDRWRFRLPDETMPSLATAHCVGAELIVTVPKLVDNALDLDQFLLVQ